MGDEQPTGTSSIKSSAPFNTAIDCLMRISNLITKISKVSVEYTLYTPINMISLTAGQAQHIKYRLVRQLYVQAVPLMTKDGKKKVVAEIQSIKPLAKDVMASKTGRKTMKYEDFDEDIDAGLDNIVIMIEEDLQEQSYFMPPRDDPRRAVLKH